MCIYNIGQHGRLSDLYELQVDVTDVAKHQQNVFFLFPPDKKKCNNNNARDLLIGSLRAVSTIYLCADLCCLCRLICVCYSVNTLNRVS